MMCGNGSVCSHYKALVWILWRATLAPGTSDTHSMFYFIRLKLEKKIKTNT